MKNIESMHGGGQREFEPTNRIADYMEYWYAITDDRTPLDALEELLAIEHNVLPGEREAYLKLKEHEQELGHPLRVTLDETGFHVIPAKEVLEK